ncbi:uncharacterized protein [Chironomus tepperi]|uniref:uncharacterized protein n=1 Tax=Chironomus tepperi TaxID=113505 RepID=UPI00391FA9C8
MIITGIFITSIFLSIIKANWITLYRSPLNESGDNIGNGIFSDIAVVNNENFGTDENSLEQTTTEAVNVERFLENLSDVYNADQAYESTTEMLSDDNDRNIKRKSNEEDLTGPPLESDSTSVASTTTRQPTTTTRQPTTSSTTTTTKKPTTTTTTTEAQPSKEQTTTTSAPSTTAKPTTTLAPSMPTSNPCLLTDSDHCEITCSNTNSTELSNALIQVINGVDSMEYPDCPFEDIRLKLVKIRFSDSVLKSSWLDDIGTNILELRIENSQSLTQITQTPFELAQFSTMETLWISGSGSSSLNLIPDISSVFIGATNLKSLTFSNFQQITFYPDVFLILSTTLKNLEISMLSNPSNYFWPTLSKLLSDSKLQNLESLNFQHIHFSNISLSRETFEASKGSMKILNFGYSNITDLTNDTFAGFTQLKDLHLENNQIMELPLGLFDDLENLESLFLQNNKLKSIPDKLFNTQQNFEKLAVVDLSGNPWYCDSNIFYLKKFLLHTTAEVTINSCDGPDTMAGIPIYDLWCKADSCTINCEFTARMELLAELEDLDMSTCPSVELHLKYHDFSDETLPDQWLSQLDFSISKLIIEHSNIKTIKNGTFASSIFENLKELIIDHNNETDLVIYEDGLLGLKSIEILKIENSAGLSLTSDYSFLEPIKNTLKEISISYIEEPFNPRLLFEHTELKNLKILHLTGNKFEFIEFTSTTFAGIHENLEEMFMVDSVVTNITADAFAGFKNLRTINLSGNDIEVLDGQFFGSDPDKKLVSVNLSNLNLKLLDIDTFKGCKQLKKLTLSQNSIANLNAGIFDDLESLEFLYLQDNLLTNIPENLFKTQLEFGNLALVNLSDNPWNCDVEIIHLKQFLIETDAETLINGCTNPNPNLFGKNIKDLWCRQEGCTLTCENTDDTTLPVALQIYDMPNCEAPFFHLISHSFINRIITNTSSSLSSLRFNVDKMHFERTDIESIQDYALKLPVFEKLRELKISQFTRFVCIINQYGLTGLNSIETVIFENLKDLLTFTSYSIFSTIQNTVRKIEIVGIIDKLYVDQLFSKPNFMNLKTIRLISNNFISTINTTSFRGAHGTLEEIYLSNTKQLSFNPDAFSLFENLKVVDFEGSDLNSIDGRFFGSAEDKKLEVVNFANTKLEMLGNDTFYGCKQLKILDLSNNSLTSLKSGTFDDLENLESLHLQNNFLNFIPKNLFKTQLESDSLKFVDLSNNPWICNPYIIYLKHFLEFTTAIVIIEKCTGPDQLVDKEIKDLWCKIDGCTIVCADTDDHLPLVLNYPKKLNCDKIEVNLHSHMPNGSSISKQFLSNLNYKIQKLVIDGSPIEQVQNYAFDSSVFEEMESLIMARNNKQLYFESNTFTGLKSIKYFKIDESLKIRWISTSNVLAPMRTTIEEIWLTNIEEAFNPCEIFEQAQFEKLKILHLDGNDLKSVNVSYFAGTHETLEELYLRNSEISKLNDNAFSRFKKLKLLDLAGNKITTIQSSHFGDLLNDENFKVFVSGNPWNCTCDMEFLLDFAADGVNATCKNPDSLSGKSIYELEDICYIPTQEPTTTEETTTTPTTTSTTTTTTPTTTSTTTTTPTTTTTTPTTTSTTTTTPTTTSTTTTTPTTTSTTTTTPTTTSTTTTTEETTPTTTSTTTTTTTTEETTPTTTSTTPTTTTTTPTTTTTEEPTTSEEPITSEESTTSTSITSTTSRTDPNPEYTGSTTTSPRGLSTAYYITCLDPDSYLVTTTHAPFLFDFDNWRNMPLNALFPVERPSYEIKKISTKEGTTDEVVVEVSDFPLNTIMLYYPSNDDPFENDKEQDERYTIRCQSVSNRHIFVKNIAPNVIYNFCIVINVSFYPYQGFSPFQCRSYQIVVGKPWLYEDQKSVILTSLSLIIITALIIGIILTYCLIRQIPTLIKGSKRVVLVNNRAKEVMILPRSSTQSSSSQSVSSSCRKESVTPIHNEPPTYLTPLPRQSFDHRPPFPRSSSDTSLKSYVSVSRLPPRFSQVYQRDDFEPACYKHHMSYPHCPPTAPYPPYQPVSDIPPPLPRRSIVSNSSSTQHSSASTVELGRTMSRAHNSTYRRHPRPIEIEQENHYNVII